MRRSLLIALFALLVAGTVQGATLTVFHRILSGNDLSITNPQTTTVTGVIRLVPRSGQSNASISFSLAPGATQNFADVLTSFSTSAASIVAIESTNTVNTNAGAMPIAFTNRTTESSFTYLSGRNNPSILDGLLTGDVRVTIFDRVTGSTLATRLYSAGTTASTLAMSLDSLVGSVSVSNGGVRIEPITGNAIVTTDYVPGRSRSVRIPGAPVPNLAITGTGYAFSSGFTASIVSPVAGATYTWTVYNGARESASTGTSVTFSIHNVGFTTVRVDVRYADGSVSSREANVQVLPVPCSAPSAQITTVPSAEALSIQTATAPSGADSYDWGISNGTILSGQGTRGISYRVGSSGTTSLSLTASNGTGCEASDSQNVAITQPAPSGSITASPSTISFGNSTTLTIVVSNVPANTQWRLRSTINGGFNDNVGMGSGTFTRTFTPIDFGPGTITNEVVGGDVFASANIQVN